MEEQVPGQPSTEPTLENSDLATDADEDLGGTTPSDANNTADLAEFDPLASMSSSPLLADPDEYQPSSAMLSLEARLSSENAQLRQELDRLKNINEHDRDRAASDIKDMSVVSALSEATWREEIDAQKDKYEAEITTLNDLLQKTMTAFDALSAEKDEVSAQAQQLQSQQQQWFEGNAAVRSQLQQIQLERDSLLEQMRSSTAKRWGRKTKPKVGPDPDLERNMAHAQTQNEMLKSIVQPMEQEIVQLKKTVKSLRQMKGVKGSGTGNKDAVVEKLKKALETERSGRSDVELQVQVLNTQKQVLQQDIQKIQMELNREKTAHADLKLTWQRANESFLDVTQNLENRVGELETELAGVRGTEILYTKSPQGSPQLKTKEHSRQSSNHDFKGSAGEEISRLNAVIDQERKDAKAKFQQLDQLTHQLRNQHESEIELHQTQWMIQRDQFEAEISAQRIQLVAHEERITELMRQIEEADESNECNMCSNYEYQLVTMQDKVTAAEAQVESAFLQAKKEHEELQARLDAQAKRYAEQSESSLRKIERDLKYRYAKEMKARDEMFSGDVVIAGERIAELEESLKEWPNALENLKSGFEDAVKAKETEVKRLRAELESRLLELSKTKTELKLLRTQSSGGTLQTANLQEGLMKSSLNADRTESMSTDELFTGENSTSPKKRQIVEALEKERARRDELKSKLRRADVDGNVSSGEVHSLSDAYEHTSSSIENLIAQLSDTSLESSVKEDAFLTSALSDEYSVLKENLELEKEERRMLEQRLKKLQQEIENGSTVQNELVAQNQKLQVSLTKMKERQGTLRWEHEGDVDQCRQCRQSFSLLKRKYHCCQCGKILCWDCLQRFGDTGREVNVCPGCKRRLKKQQDSVTIESGRTRFRAMTR